MNYDHPRTRVRLLILPARGPTMSSTTVTLMAFALFSVAARAAVPSAAGIGRAAAFAIPTCGRSAAASSSCRATHPATARPSIHHRPFGLLSAPTPSALFSTAKADTAADTKKDPVPVTLLAGFLGSGKTSALKNLLENRDGIRVGVIVNDVAAVNIDAKLIANPGNSGEDPPPPPPQTGEAGAAEPGTAIDTDYGGTVELQNGCACCSLADELLVSVQTLMDGRDFDAVVVELSGVADPVAVKQNWEMARAVSW